MNDSVPYVDLSMMPLPPKCAVICRDIEELDIFFANLQEQIPECLYWDYDEIKNLWHYYGDKTGFTLFDCDDEVPGSMTYCDYDWFVSEGYAVIELSSLLNTADIEESDLPFIALFGGVL